MNTVQMFEEAKKKYIESWNGHAKDFYGLAFCSDKVLSRKVTDCIKQLQELIPLIADTKKSFSGMTILK